MQRPKLHTRKVLPPIEATALPRKRSSQRPQEQLCRHIFQLCQSLWKVSPGAIRVFVQGRRARPRLQGRRHWITASRSEKRGISSLCWCSVHAPLRWTAIAPSHVPHLMNKCFILFNVYGKISTFYSILTYSDFWLICCHPSNTNTFYYIILLINKQEILVDRNFFIQLYYTTASTSICLRQHSRYDRLTNKYIYN